MAIPIFEDFLYPFISFLGKKDMSTKEMKAAIIQHFNLTEEDCALRTKNGTSTQLNDRLNWTRQYLRRALFVDLPARGVYHLSDRGRAYLNTHTDLRKKDLMEYPEFSSYATGNSVVAPKVTPAEAPVEEVTPTEQLESAFDIINNDLSAELLQRVLEQTPIFFERLVVDLLVRMGYGGSFANSADRKSVV